MFVGRFLMIVPMLAIAGSLAAKKSAPVNAGTFPTHGPLFVGLLVGVVLIVGGLTYLPALALGPIVEHLAMLSGQPVLMAALHSSQRQAPPPLSRTSMVGLGPTIQRVSMGTESRRLQTNSWMVVPSTTLTSEGGKHVNGEGDQSCPRNRARRRCSTARS